MGSALTNTQIKNSYLDVCQLGNSGGGITAALQAICGGSGTASPLQISTVGVRAITHSAFGAQSAINSGSLILPSPGYLISDILDIEEIVTDTSTVDRNDGVLVYLQVDSALAPGPAGYGTVFGTDVQVETKTGNSTNYSLLQLQGNNTAVTHNGNGNLDTIYGFDSQLFNRGLGTINLVRCYDAFIAGNSGTITAADGIGIQISAFGGAITTARGLYVDIEKFSGTIGTVYGMYVDSIVGTTTAAYGVYVADQSGAGSTIVENVHSAGSSSNNVFEGSISVGSTVKAVASAILEVDSTTRGILFPRMTTTQKNAISSPAEGLVVYDTSLHKLCVRTAATWETITSS